MLERGRKSTKIGLVMGVIIGGDAEKSGKNTHLLVIIHVSFHTPEVASRIHVRLVLIIFKLMLWFFVGTQI